MAEHITELSNEEVEAVSGAGGLFILGSFNDFNKTRQTNVAIQPVTQKQFNFLAAGGDQVAVPIAIQTNYNETNQ